LIKTDVKEVGVFIGERLRARAVRPATDKFKRLM